MTHQKERYCPHETLISFKELERLMENYRRVRNGTNSTFWYACGHKFTLTKGEQE